jgi:hypothetical protein
MRLIEREVTVPPTVRFRLLRSFGMCGLVMLWMRACAGRRPELIAAV